MPKHATHRSQRNRATPYDRAYQTTIARLRVANERIEMLKYAKAFIDGCEDDMEAKHAEPGLRLQMIHLQKKLIWLVGGILGIILGYRAGLRIEDVWYITNPSFWMFYSIVV
ncbi:hypothetical protein SNK03_011892 [Fusarium graminearum]